MAACTGRAYKFLLWLLAHMSTHTNHTAANTFAFLPAFCADIAGMSWSKASRGSVLHVKRSEGPPISFLGFRDKDVEVLRSITNRQIADDPLATRWGRGQAPAPWGSRRSTAGATVSNPLGEFRFAKAALAEGRSAAPALPASTIGRGGGLFKKV